MKANVPERLYLSKNIYSTYLYQVPDPDDETAVEYTRTDVFIEKTYNWLKNYAFVDDNNNVNLSFLLHDFLKDSRNF